jgi:hypothetical protein
MNLARRGGPVLLALALGLLSVPFVAVLLIQPLPDYQQQIVEAPSLSWLDAVRLALVSAMSASVVGGFLGGAVIRSRLVAGTLVAIGIAWPVGIGMLSITASTLGIGLRLAIVCSDTCNSTSPTGTRFQGSRRIGVRSYSVPNSSCRSWRSSRSSASLPGSGAAAALCRPSPSQGL